MMKNHFDFTPTPLTRIQSISAEYNCNFFMKRDDLFEHGGGGSKARMLQYILFRAASEGADYILTAGGPYSNFNRALALLCAKYQFKMRLVLYDKNQHINKMSLNRRVLDFCDVEIVDCNPENVVNMIEEQKKELINKGHTPYYVWGGGKSKEGVEAYRDCFKEIIMEKETDYVFTAVGTGTTFTGLATSPNRNKETEIIGISVARSKEICDEVISGIMKECGIDKNCDLANTKILDNYLLGGYGISNEELDSFIQNFTIREGVIVDKIYVGKALYGTLKHLDKIQEKILNKNIVFLNTGGLYNF